MHDLHSMVGMDVLAPPLCANNSDAISLTVWEMWLANCFFLCGVACKCWTFGLRCCGLHGLTTRVSRPNKYRAAWTCGSSATPTWLRRCKRWDSKWWNHRLKSIVMESVECGSNLLLYFGCGWHWIWLERVTLDLTTIHMILDRKPRYRYLKTSPSFCVHSFPCHCVFYNFKFILNSNYYYSCELYVIGFWNL